MGAAAALSSGSEQCCCRAGHLEGGHGRTRVTEGLSGRPRCHGGRKTSPGTLHALLLVIEPAAIVSAPPVGTFPRKLDVLAKRGAGRDEPGASSLQPARSPPLHLRCSPDDSLKPWKSLMIRVVIPVVGAVHSNTCSRCRSGSGWATHAKRRPAAWHANCAQRWWTGSVSVRRQTFVSQLRSLHGMQQRRGRWTGRRVRPHGYGLSSESVTVRLSNSCIVHAGCVRIPRWLTQLGQGPSASSRPR